MAGNYITIMLLTVAVVLAVKTLYSVYKEK